MEGNFSLHDLPQDPLRRRLALSGGLVALGLAACSGENAPPATPEKRVTIPAALPPPKRVDAPDLEAHGLLLPGLVDSASEGAFIDLIKAVDAAYGEGDIAIRVFPSARGSRPVTLAGGESFTASELSSHLKTNVGVIEKFRDARFWIDVGRKSAKVSLSAR